MQNRPIRRNNLPLFLRKKMAGGGPMDEIQGGSDPLTWQSQTTPIVPGPAPAEQMYQTSPDSRIEDTPSFAYTGQPDVQTPQRPLGLPSLMDSMYVANVGLRGISEMAARGKQQDYIQSNTANPLANLAFNDGQSDRVKYGYEQFGEGGGLYDYLNSTGRTRAKGFGDTRKALAASLGFKNYRGTAEQNTTLLNLLKQADERGVSPFTVQNPVRRHAEYRQEAPKQAPRQVESPRVPENTGVENVIPKSNLSFLRKQDMSFLDNSPSINDIYNSTNRPKPIKTSKDTKVEPQLPQSGVIVDKRTGQGYVTDNGKVIKRFPVLTGKDVNANINSANVSDDERSMNGKATPVGYYRMNGAGNHLSSMDRNEFQGNVQRLQPISAFGMEAPRGDNLGIHQTYDPQNRDKLYNTSNPYATYGCVNCHKPDIKDINNRFPNGDTLMVVDSKDPKFSKAISKLKKKGGNIRGLKY